jgi:hypothetical protein
VDRLGNDAAEPDMNSPKPLTSAKRLPAKGRWSDVTEDGYHFDDDELEDGRSVRVPMYLMDAVDAKWAFDARDHQPGYRPLSDSVTDAKVEDARSAARDARDEMIRRTQDAWRCAGHAELADIGARCRFGCGALMLFPPQHEQ